MHLRILGFVVGALGLAVAPRAQAVPVFTNSNFIDNFAGPSYYGVPSGWTFAGFGAGSAPQDKNSFWDNGSAINNPSRVGFIQNIGSTQSSLSQTVSGFIIGDTYTIGAYADARTSQAAALDIVLNGVTTLLATTIAPVASSGNFVTPFGSYVSASFVARSSFNTISFMNGSLGMDTALLLTNSVITDVTAANTLIPEPISIALLGAGLVGLAVSRKIRLGSA